MSVVPHHDGALKETVPDAVIMRKASTFPELMSDEIRTAPVPGVVVAAPGIHSVWSVTPTLASASRSITVFTVDRSSLVRLTNQPVALLVETAMVVVANCAAPGDTVPNELLLTVKESDGAPEAVPQMRCAGYAAALPT